MRSGGSGRKLGFHCVVLVALAVAMPLCDLLRQSPEFLWVHGLAATQVAGLVLVLLVVAPLPLLGLLWLSRRAPLPVQVGIAVASPLALLALQLSVGLEWSGWAAIVLVAAGAGAGAAAYLRTSSLRRFVTLLALVALVGPGQLLVAVSRGSSAYLAVDGLELGRTGSRAPIVFIIFDELPMLSLLAGEEAWDVDNFPNFARLAASAHTFLEARSVSTATLAAVSSIIAGRATPLHQEPTTANHPRNLFTLFGGDHEIWAAEPVTAMCPPSLNRRPPDEDRASTLLSDLVILWLTVSVPQPWAAELPSVDMVWSDFAKAESDGAEGADLVAEDSGNRDGALRAGVRARRTSRAAQFRAFIRAIESGKRGRLYFIHSLLPHGPLLYTPAGKLYDRGERAKLGGRGDFWTDSNEEIVALAYQRHLLQAQFVDKLLGELLDHLVATSIFEDAMIVVTSDHGVSLRPGQPPRDSAGRNPEETLWVPLLIKEPGQRSGQVHRRPVATTSILSAMLEFLDVAAPWPTEVTPAGQETEQPTSSWSSASAARAWKVRVFGDPPDSLPPLRLNRHADLIGRRVGDFESHPRDDVELRRLDPGETLFYDPASSSLPTWITGVLIDRSEVTGCCDLAFAVDDRIVAVHRTYSGSRGMKRFQALLPEDSLRPGANKLRVLVVEGAGGSRRLLAPKAGFSRRVASRPGSKP